MGYWINFDPPTGVNRLHRGDCEHVRKWARPPKWRRFETEEDARNAVAESRLRECKDCLGN